MKPSKILKEIKYVKLHKDVKVVTKNFASMSERNGFIINGKFISVHIHTIDLNNPDNSIVGIYSLEDIGDYEEQDGLENFSISFSGDMLIIEQKEGITNESVAKIFDFR